MVKAPTPAFMPSFNGPEGQEDMPWLMTAGPVVTSREVKLAMLADWSVRDAEFTSLVLRVTEEVLQLANAAETHDCIPLNMSGMAALESIAGALCPSGRKRLTLVAGSGPCAEQLTTILTHNKRPWQPMKAAALKPVTARQLVKALADVPEIQTVYLVHVDPATGIVNPVEELAALAHEAGKTVIVDARYSLGAMPLDLSSAHVDAAIAVPWSAMGGVPGFSFVIAQRELLGAKLTASPSASLDLFELWNGIHRTGRFPGTPPSQALGACSVALRDLDLEGGPDARLARFRRVHKRLLGGLTRLGFEPVIQAGEEVCGYITLFQPPSDPQYQFASFAQRLRQQGFVIMDGEGCPVAAGGFRVSTMGLVDEDVVDRFIETVEHVMRDMGVRSGKAAAG
jgi:2-aminoethylphosphonate-pyruvate transaminase